MQGKGEEKVHCVKYPPKDYFVGRPGRVSLAELLGGYGLLVVCISRVIGVKHLVNGGENVAYHMGALPWPPLQDGDKFVEVDINVSGCFRFYFRGEELSYIIRMWMGWGLLCLPVRVYWPQS